MAGVIATIVLSFSARSITVLEITWDQEISFGGRRLKDLPVATSKGLTPCHFPTLSCSAYL